MFWSSAPNTVIAIVGLLLAVTASASGASEPSREAPPHKAVVPTATPAEAGAPQRRDRPHDTDVAVRKIKFPAQITPSAYGDWDEATR